MDQALDHRLVDAGLGNDIRVRQSGIHNTYLNALKWNFQYLFEPSDNAPHGSCRLRTARADAVGGEPDRSFTTDEIASEFEISCHHLIKVVRGLEDDQPLAECFRADGGTCVLTPRCRLKKRLAAARQAFLDELDATSLADCAYAPAGGR
jgi:Rrf2 family nitric oxide-sensitive transcriptional repressor